MALRDLSDPNAVRRAIQEYDEIGREAFLARYGFRPALRYYLSYNGSHYDSKAVVAAAHGYQFPGKPLRAYEFVGGLSTVVPKLRSLGFDVVDTSRRGEEGSSPVPSLELGRIYTWEELADLFDFDPGYLTRVGGMVSRPAFDAILLITHPGGARTIDYGDYWDGDDLIYTGHGQRGDQQRSGTNRDTGDNARTLLAFEQAGPRQLKFLGQVECVDEWRARAEDVDGNDREVIRFRLKFERGGRPLSASTAPPPPDDEMRRRRRHGGTVTSDVVRKPRPFDPTRRPTPRASTGPGRTPEEIAAESDKATQGHHDLLVALDARLRGRGWSDIEEFQSAIDLWARNPEGSRVLFEAKTLAGSELERLRAAAIQLLEYRFFYGRPDDGLCVVTDRPISDRQSRFLSSLQIAVIFIDGDGVHGASPLARSVVTNLID